MSIGRFGSASPEPAVARHSSYGGTDGTELLDAARQLVVSNAVEGDLTATQQLAANAATLGRQAVGTTVNPQTTSTSYVDLDEMTLTFTPAVVTDMLVLFFCTFDNVGANNTTTLALNVDGVVDANFLMQQTNANASQQTPGAMHKILAAVTAASHTIKIQYKVSAGTGEVPQVYRVLNVTELKR